MSSQPLIANEVLAFINHAIDYMDEVSILQICKSNFKEEEISSAKLLLYQSLGKVEQMQSRRRDGGQKCVQDIITLMKSTDPDDVPAFVAKELHKLPPVTFDHVDVTRLLKDITSLKKSLAEVQTKLEESNNTIGELRAQVVLLCNAISVNGSPSASNTNAHRDVENACTASPLRTADTRVATCAAAVADSTPVEVVTHVGTPTPKRAYAAIVATQKGGHQSCCEPVNQAQKQQGPVKGTCDEDGFEKVERKKKRKPPSRNKCGTALAGPSMLLRPAIPTTQLYVSRLHHSTKGQEIVEYLRVKTNWDVRVEMLESRHNTNFKSFVVRVPTQHIAKFLREDLWPKGVVYRKFRGRLRDTTQRNTTPSLRVK